MGEGGGQILRTSLALGLVTGTPFRIENIRAGRKKPGLLRQHLTAVNAAASVGAEIQGAELGSSAIEVRPGRVSGGDHHFSIGSAGSACLVLQAVLPALLRADEESRIVLEGGTHNPYAPPFDFIERVFIPVLSRMGASVKAELERPGFFPAGGGRFRVVVQPVSELRAIEILERGAIVNHCARALVSNLPGSIAKRELAVVRERLGWEEENLHVVQNDDTPGPGNVLLLELVSEHVREICSAFGEREVRAESVARRAVGLMRRYIASGVPVGAQLADQLVIPFALAGGGSFRTLPLTEHSRTNISVVKHFLPIEIRVRESEENSIVEFSRAQSVR